MAEGVKTVTEIIDKKPGIIRAVYGTENFISRHIDRFQKLKFFYNTVTEEELKKISFQSSPNNVLAVCSYLEEEPSAGTDVSVALFLDDIRDPGNFGTILRLASWFGVGTVFCSPATCELYNPKVIQSTMGAFMRIKVVYTTLDEVRKQFALPVYGAVLDGEDLFRAKLQPGILVIGNEANGISAENLAMISHPVTIPAARNNETESLNAAVAASVILAEFFKQGVIR